MSENRNQQPITKEMLNNFIRNLCVGDEVYLPEYKDNPDTKFGRVKVKKMWTVAGKFPYTVKLQHRTKTGRVEIRTIPYAVLMTTEQ